MVYICLLVTNVTSRQGAGSGGREIVSGLARWRNPSSAHVPKWAFSRVKQRQLATDPLYAGNGTDYAACSAKVCRHYRLILVFTLGNIDIFLIFGIKYSCAL